MFVSDFNDKSASEVQLNCIDCDTFPLIIDWIYDGRIVINNENVAGLIQNANYLSLIKLVDVCFEFLTENLKIEDVLEVRKLAEHYQNPDLIKECEFVIAENIDLIIERNYLLDTEYVQMKEIVEPNLARITNSENLCKFVVDWLELDNSRHKYDCDLVELVFSPSLPKSAIQILYSSKVISNGIKWLGFLLDEVSIKTFKGSGDESLEGLVFITGGFIDRKSVRIFDLNEEVWKEGTPMQYERYHHECCVVDNKIFAIGGWEGPNNIEQLSFQKWTMIDTFKDNVR